MSISIPKQRTYFLASPNEIDDLLCWIPPQEYEAMLQQGQITQAIVDDYPLGLEVVVSQEDFERHHLRLGVTPQMLKETYLHAWEKGELPPDGRVLGTDLERWAEEAEASGKNGGTDWRTLAASEGIPELREPATTDGDDAMTVLSRLS